jgi:hypothetical protein
MNAANASARRYHWHSERVDDLVCEPHSAIVTAAEPRRSLNLTASESGKTRDLSVDLVGGGYRALMKDIEILRRHSSHLSRMVSLREGPRQLTFLELADAEFTVHPVVCEDFSSSHYLEKILGRLCDETPEAYETLLSTAGVGPKTVRALALVGEIIYGAEPSYEDPARYSFAHGGKDATPYPVDRATYDRTIAALAAAVKRTRISAPEKDKAVRRLVDSRVVVVS